MKIRRFTILFFAFASVAAIALMLVSFRSFPDTHHWTSAPFDDAASQRVHLEIGGSEGGAHDAEHLAVQADSAASSGGTTAAPVSVSEIRLELRSEDPDRDAAEAKHEESTRQLIVQLSKKGVTEDNIVREFTQSELTQRWGELVYEYRTGLLIQGPLSWGYEDMMEMAAEYNAFTSQPPSASVPTSTDIMHWTALDSPDPSKEPPQSAVDNFREVKEMLPGHCPIVGFARLTETIGYKPGKLQLIAQPGVVTRFGDGKGMQLLLVNATTGKQLDFSEEDGHLCIVQEAVDEDGAWKPIEYFQHSWCGNSYRHHSLGPNEYVGFSAARYKGPFQTKLRFRLPIDGGLSIYSNVFDGSIHKEQFEAKQGHRSNDVMDPYGW